MKKLSIMLALLLFTPPAWAPNQQLIDNLLKNPIPSQRYEDRKLQMRERQLQLEQQEIQNRIMEEQLRRLEIQNRIMREQSVSDNEDNWEDSSQSMEGLSPSSGSDSSEECEVNCENKGHPSGYCKRMCAGNSKAY